MKRFTFKVLAFFIQSALLFFYCSNSMQEQISVLPGLNENYLALNEKFWRDYYGDEDAKTNALQILKLRCEKREIQDAHSCYNLSVLHFQSKEYQKAYDASLKAIEKRATDGLYQNMLRQAALQSNQIHSLSLLKHKNREILNLYNQMIYHCYKKEEAKVIQNLKELITKKYISSNILQTGLLTTCIKEEEKRTAKKVGSLKRISIFLSVWKVDSVFRFSNAKRKKKMPWNKMNTRQKKTIRTKNCF